MTPAEAAVLAAARAYRDAHMRCLRGEPDSPDGIDMDAAADSLLTAATLLVDVAEPPVATTRPWPDPEAYRALACVFVIKPLDPSRSLPPGTNLSALFGVDIVDVLE